MLVAKNNYLLKNASALFTLDAKLGKGPLGIMENADVLVKGGKISAIGHNLPCAGASTIDASGRFVLPGFVDAHDHLWQSVIRARGCDQELPGWLSNCNQRYGKALHNLDVYNAVLLSAANLISMGITTVLDWSHAYTIGFARENVAALQKSGLRWIMAYAGSREHASLEEILSLFGKDLSRLQLGVRPLPSEADDLQVCARLSLRYNLVPNYHLLEHVSDTKDNPIELLKSTGIMKTQKHCQSCCPGNTKRYFAAG